MSTLTYWRPLRLALAAGIGLAAAVMLLPRSAIAQTATTMEGRLGVVWGDPRPGVLAGGTVLFELYRDDGTSVPVSISAAQRNIAIGAFGERVRLQGQPGVDAAGRSSLQATSIELLDAARDRSAVGRSVIGTRRALNILVRYSGDAQQPNGSAFFQALMTAVGGSPAHGIPASADDFYRLTSWNRLRWASDTVGVGGLNPTVWLTLPGTKTTYANCGWASACAGPNLGTLFDQAVALAVAQGVNMALYDNINIMLNNDLDCCAWGGSRFYNGKRYGVTWNPPWAQRPGIFVHELGHSIGLPHSGWVYFAYDSHWDQMSRGTVASSILCGSYTSANSGVVRNINCDKPGSGFLAAYKDHLGWIPATKRLEVNSVSTQRVWLTSNAAKLALEGYKVIKLCLPDFPCTGPTARYYTIEARVRSGDYETSLPNEGVVIHEFIRNRSPIGGGNPCFFNTQSGWAVPVDRTPGDYDAAPTCSQGTRVYPNWGLHNAQFGPGHIFERADLGVRVRVIRRKGARYAVEVVRTR